MKYVQFLVSTLAVTDAVYLGCMIDSQGSRSLSSKNELKGKNSPIACEEFCINENEELDEDDKYVVFGLQYSFECFCGTKYDDVTLNGVAEDEGQCKLDCPGDSEKKCGGFNRFNAYSITETTTNTPSPSIIPTTSPVIPSIVPTTSPVIPSTNPSTNPTTIPTVIPTTSPVIPTPSPSIVPTTSPVIPSIIPTTSPVIPTPSPSIVPTTSPVVPSTSPVVPVPTTNPTTTVVPTTSPVIPPVVPPVVPSSAVYLGCMIDSQGSRSLSSKNELKGANSPIACEELCISKNEEYVVFGLQYGFECFCGTKYDDVTLNGVAEDEGQCKLDCPGDSDKKCGGFNRFNAYSIYGVTESPSPVTVTESPVTVTESPVTVTESPVTVTESPVTVTESPVVTVTESPVTVTLTESPVVTVTESPVTVTETESPVTVTETESPVTVTETESPVTVVTESPVTVVTESPVTVVTESPVTVVTESPVVTVTESPVVTVTESPVTVTETGLGSCFFLSNPSPGGDGTSVQINLLLGPVLNDWYDQSGSCELIVHTDSVEVNGICSEANNHDDDYALRDFCASEYGGYYTREYRECYWNEDTVDDVAVVSTVNLGDNALVEFFDDPGCKKSIGSVVVDVQN